MRLVILMDDVFCDSSPNKLPARNQMGWQEHFRNQGFAHFEGLTPDDLVMAALKAIEFDLI